MAKVYRAPIDAPDIIWHQEEGETWLDVSNKNRERNEEYIRKLAEIAKGNAIANNDEKRIDLYGEVIRFGVADGYAQYMVWNLKPLELVWLELDDAYSIPAAHIRGLRFTDIKEMVERERSIAELFKVRS